MIYLKAAITALGATGLITRLIMTAGLAGALLVGYGIWHHKVYREGYTRALADIAAEDARAIGRATQFRQTWRECRDRHGVWDQSKGTCT